MPPAMPTMNEPSFSKTELKVQAIASRRAKDQLMRVPWTKFRGAYEEYPRWQALALWAQAISSKQDGLPSWLAADLQKHCPGFMEHETASREQKPLALRLLEWVHNREFGYAKRQGWLNALTFYGVRHLRSERAWAYWEHCENEWNRKHSTEFPLFDEWWHTALQVKLRDEISYLEVAKAVETYIDWRALLLWLRPLFASDAKLLGHVKFELERRCPDIFDCQNPSKRQSTEKKPKIRQHLIRWGKRHCLMEPKQAGWIDLLLQGVRFHPRYVRFMAYGKHWAKERSRNRARPYPSFREWRQAADRYIDAGPK